MIIYSNLIVSGYLSYYPFTARYKRNDLSCYKTTDKRNHCDTWYSGNSGKRQCIFEHSHPQSEPEYVHKIHAIAKFDVSVTNLGACGRLIHVNIRNVPVVRSTQLIVQKAHPISITGVEWSSPGIACT